MSTPISKVPGTLPYDCYPTAPQELNVDIVNLMSLFLDENFPGIYVNSTEPPADQRDRVWFNTTNQRLYWYVNGAWQRKYEPWASSGDLRMIETDVDTYNAAIGGGPSTEGIGDSTGPLWVAATEYAGAVPVGTGLVPASIPALTLSLGDTGGAPAVALDDLKYIPYHGHNLPSDSSSWGAQPGVTMGAWCPIPTFQDGGSAWRPPSDNKFMSSGNFKFEGGDPTTHATVAHANMQPYKAVNFVRRSARIYVPSPY